MSDPHVKEEKRSSEEIENKYIYFVKILSVFTLFFILVIYFYFDPSSAQLISGILNVIQIISLVAIVFMVYKLWNFMGEFGKNGAAIVENYNSKLKHKHHDEHDVNLQIENKYNLAMQQLNSEVDNEWKSGLVDLDNYIRLVLLDKGYQGSTTLELLNDAKLKGHQHVEEAENIAYLRQRLKTKGIHFDFSKKDLDILVKKFDWFKKTLNDNNH